GAVRAGVLDGIRERLRHDEVGAGLDPRWEPVDRHVDRYGYCDTRDERLDAGAEPATGQRRGKDAVRELAQLSVCLLRLVERFRHAILRRRLLVGQLALRQLERDDSVDE